LAKLSIFTNKDGCQSAILKDIDVIFGVLMHHGYMYETTKYQNDWLTDGGNIHIKVKFVTSTPTTRTKMAANRATLIKSKNPSDMLSI